MAQARRKLWGTPMALTRKHVKKEKIEERKEGE